MHHTSDLLQKADQYLAGATLGMFKLPASHQMVIDRGEGCRVWDTDGREYIDYTLGSGPMILGHAHPAVLRTVNEQSKRGSTFYGLNTPAIDLAEQIAAAAPGVDQVRFTTSGTDATFSAIRLARAYTGKEKVLKFDGGWHGGHDYAQHDADPEDSERSRPISDGIPSAATGSVITCPFNDSGRAVQLIEEHASDLAAVIVEPLQRAIPPADGFLSALRSSARKNGVIFIMDEIVTGFRLAWGGAQERYDVAADLVTYGKTISGGYPLAAVCGRKELMQCAAPEQKGSGSYAFISGTFNGNPVSCAAGLATLDALSAEGTYEHLHRIPGFLKDGLEEIGTELGLPLRVLGDGPVLQPFFSETEIRNHAESQASDLTKQQAFGLGMLEKGFFVNPTGKLYLSTLHTLEIIDQTLAAAREVLSGLR